jgi:hypothetical protein
VYQRRRDDQHGWATMVESDLTLHKSSTAIGDSGKSLSPAMLHRRLKPGGCEIFLLYYYTLKFSSSYYLTG